MKRRGVTKKMSRECVSVLTAVYLMAPIVYQLLKAATEPRCDHQEVCKHFKKKGA